MVSILLAEDASIIRSALRAMLEKINDVSVVGDVTVPELVKAATRIQPDVVLISATHPRREHLPVIRTITKLPKRPGVAYLSRYKYADFLREFFMSGGSACILDRGAVSTLSAAIRRVAAGRNYIDPDVSDEMIVALVGERGRPRTGALSKREEDVLRLIAHGYTQKEIAQKMGISPSTVDTYASRLREKLDLRERSDLVRYAMTSGIVSVGSEHDVA
jgi:two-component system response regulator NreC